MSDPVATVIDGIVRGALNGKFGDERRSQDQSAASDLARLNGGYVIISGKCSAILHCLLTSNTKTTVSLC